MASPEILAANPDFDMAQQLLRRAAIEDLRPEVFLVSVVGSVIACVQRQRGQEQALILCRALALGSDEIAELVRAGEGSA
jgi:hypothetical protein